MTNVLFGVNVPAYAGADADPVGAAQQAEELGFDFISSSDHPCGSSPTFETWTMLTWLAAATSRIGIATRVLGTPYRPPPMVAKMAATLDQLSNGRLILGLGGGYSDDEFRAFGLGVPSPREKVDRMEEAIRIIRGLWSEPGFTFEGRHYHTQAADLEPKPRRRIPIWLGTYGPRALAVTGRLADGWIPSLGFAPPEDIEAMRERIVTAARAAGRDTGELTFAYNVGVRIQPHAEARPGIVSGTATEVAERLHEFVRLGFGAFNFMPTGPDTGEQIATLAREVIPAVRAG